MNFFCTKKRFVIKIFVNKFLLNRIIEMRFVYARLRLNENVNVSKI